LHAGFSYYRNIPRDAADNKALLDSGKRLAILALALGGARTEAHGAEEPEQSLREIANKVEGGVIADSRHFIPEEQPAVLAERLLDFFALRRTQFPDAGSSHSSARGERD
jgi:pimeloyl-ACP methyl ester carboxylesterase